MKVFGQLEKAVIENLGADPTGTGLVEGRIWYRTDLFVYRAYSNSVVTEFADLASAQTFVNKTLTSPLLTTPEINGATTYDEVVTPANPASSKHKIYFKADGSPYTLDSLGSEQKLGSGSGSGSKNYVPDNSSDIESTIGDWLTDDGAASPSTILSLAVTSVVGEALVNGSSLKFSKTAFDGSGHYFKLLSKAIDPADYEITKTLQWAFEFKPLTGYVSGDIVLEVYDVTNAAVLYTTGVDDLALIARQGGVLVSTHLENTTAQVEMRLKVNNTNTNAYDFTADAFTIGPDKTVPGFIATEWKPFTASFLGLTTNPTRGTVGSETAQYRRMGDSMEIHWSYVQTAGGTAGSGAYLLEIPDGLAIDFSKIGNGGSSGQGACGSAQIDDGAGNQGIGTAVAYDNGSKVGILLNAYNEGADNISSFGSAYYPFTIPALRVSFTAKVPIVGWKSTNLISTTENMFKNVDVRGQGNGGTSITANVTDIDFTTISNGSGTWNGSQFTAPETGKYSIQGMINTTSAASFVLYAYIDGVIDKQMGRDNISATQVDFGGHIYLQKGEVWSLRSNTTRTLSNQVLTHWISISQIKDTSVFGVYSNPEYFGSISSLKVPVASNTHLQMVGNDLTLPPGTHELKPSLIEYSNTGVCGYVRVPASWQGSNGSDTGAAPTLLSALPGVTIISATNAGGAGNVDQLPGSNNNWTSTTPSVIIKCTQTTTVYLVPYVIVTTPSNAQVRVFVNAERKV